MKNFYNGIDIDQLNSELAGKFICHHINNKFNPTWSSKNSSHFTCFLETQTGKFVKVMNKNLVWRWDPILKYNIAKPMTDAEENETVAKLMGSIESLDCIEKSEFDTAEFASTILKSGKYKFLPEVVFDTENYIGTEWLGDGWRSCTTDDLIQNILGKSIPTKLFRKIAFDVIRMQEENAITLTTDKYVKAMEFYKSLIREYFTNIDEATLSKFESDRQGGKFTTAFKSLHIQDIIINKSDPMMWAYVDMENLETNLSINRSFFIDETCDQYVDEAGFGLPRPCTIHDVNIANYFYSGKWHTMSI
jgi:hypothetical protein